MREIEYWLGRVIARLQRWCGSASALAVVVVVVGLSGCRSSPPTPPTRDWPGARSAVRAINQRTRRIKRLSTYGRLTMVLPDKRHKRITVDLIMVAQRPERTRLQILKLDHRVIDMLVKPEGMWLWTSDRIDARQVKAMLGQSAKAKRSTARSQTPGQPRSHHGENQHDPRQDDIAIHGKPGLWRPLLDPIPTDEMRVIKDEPASDTLVIAWPAINPEAGSSKSPSAKHPAKARPNQPQPKGSNQAWTWRATINRSTQTIKAYRLINTDRRVVQRLDLDHYQQINDIAFPTRLRGHGRIRFKLELDHTTINQPLAPGAFDKPAGAKKVR